MVTIRLPVSLKLWSCLRIFKEPAITYLNLSSFSLFPISLYDIRAVIYIGKPFIEGIKPNRSDQSVVKGVYLGRLLIKLATLRCESPKPL